MKKVENGNKYVFVSLNQKSPQLLYKIFGTLVIEVGHARHGHAKRFGQTFKIFKNI